MQRHGVITEMRTIMEVKEKAIEFFDTWPGALVIALAIMAFIIGLNFVLHRMF